MPVPLIELQRRLSIVGAIRAGGEKEPNRPGKKLEAFRLTSARQELIQQAAQLYGGTVSPWEASTGREWQVYTDAEELPVLVIPHYSLKQTYELWEGATKRMRLCDGEEEQLTGQPCLCNAEGVDRCDLYTRLVVALPELDTVLGWRLITKGANAAHELPTLLALMEAKGGTFVPARLRLDQRRGVKDGQVLRYVVPTLDLGIGYLALAQPEPDGSRALGAGPGFTPTTRREPTVEEALAARPPSLTPGRTAAFGPDHAGAVDPEAQPASAPPQPAAPAPAPAAEPASEPEPRPQSPKASAPTKKRADVLVGKLRREGHLTTDKLYNAIAGLRKMGGEELVLLVGGYDAELQLHWAPLRDALTQLEASQLIAWLEAKELKVAGQPPSYPDTVDTEPGDSAPD
jgi:hypothetical protein